MLDSNLAILHVVGQVDRSLIGRHKRLGDYRAADYDLLARIISRANGIIFCPNVLTETSNLVVYGVDGLLRTRIRETFSDLVAKTEEVYVESATAVERAEYGRLGLTDAVLLECCGPNSVLVTTDHDLYLAAVKARYDVIDFRQHRTVR